MKNYMIQGPVAAETVGRRRPRASLCSLLSTAFVSVLSIPQAGAFHCEGWKAESVVDWSLTYKLPRHVYDAQTGELIDTGGYSTVFFSQVGSNPIEMHFASPETNPDYMLNASDPITRMLRRVTSETTVVTYNDQPYKKLDGGSGPPAASLESGHTKGYVVADESDELVWVAHSVPKYLKNASDPEYTPAETRNGQYIECMTLKPNSNESKNDLLGRIAESLLFMHANACPCQISPSVLTSVPALANLSRHHYPRTGPRQYRTQNYQTVNGLEMVHYFRNSALNATEDYWKSMAEDQIKHDLDAQTWHDASVQPVPPNCSGAYSVEVVTNITMSFLGRLIVFGPKEDHSKVAYLVDQARSKGPVVPVSKIKGAIFGDLNLDVSQIPRGGGARYLKNMSSLPLNCTLDVEKCGPAFIGLGVSRIP